MWEQYRKTFRRIQVVIAIVTCGVLFITRMDWLTASAFLIVMEFSAVVGALWGVRLRNIVLWTTGRKMPVARERLPLEGKLRPLHA